MEIGIPEIERKYEILEKMGEGGMGAIYRARHRYLDEIRVIKTIRPQLRSNEEMQGRFLQEAKVAAKLRHPNIASIHDFTMTDDGLACIVMEHIEGCNLRQVQKERGRFTVSQALFVARQVLSALEYLHQRQFVHRDIATDNLMLGAGEDGRPKVTLIDLGLAKSLEAPVNYTRTGIVVGKMHYIAPEQLSRGAAGVTIDGRCDLYAFGVVLYELLTCRLPIAGDDAVSLIAGHLSRAPRSFDETDPTGEVPAGLRAVVMRSLAKQPAERYATASAMARALESSVAVEVGELDAGADDAVQQTLSISQHLATPAATVGELAGRTVAVNPSLVTRMRNRWQPRARDDAEGGRARGWRRSGVVAAALAAVALAAVVIGVLAGRFVAGRGAATDQAEAAAAGVSPPAEIGEDDAGAVFFGRSHALLIGNNAYRALPPLETAVNDVRAIGAALEQRFGFAVTVLENATRKQTLDALSGLLSTLTARDNLLVYYAGHGNIQFNRESWQPIDAEPDDTSYWISTQYEISEPMEVSSVRHVLVVSDSCFAGAGAGDAPAAAPAAGGQASVAVLASRVSRMVMTSGGLSPVLDQGDGHLSIFARALVDSLEEVDDVRSVSEIFAALRPRVVAAAHAFAFEQQPTLAPIPGVGDEGGELFFVPASG